MLIHPLVALWTVPRSASTAFERMMAERGDYTVFHEPFSVHYYYGPQKRSSRYDEVRDDGDVDAVVAKLDRAARERPVFLKDMAYHAVHLLEAGRLGALGDRLVHTFLIRDPAWTIPSLAAVWPDFTDEEAGFAALARLVDANDGADEPPVIVDSDDLRADPPGVVRAYCGRVDIPYVADALHWEPGMRDDWRLWGEWHAGTAKSSGFVSPSGEPPAEVTDERVRAAIDRARPVYEQLRARRLLPS